MQVSEAPLDAELARFAADVAESIRQADTMREWLKTNAAML